MKKNVLMFLGSALVALLGTIIWVHAANPCTSTFHGTTTYPTALDTYVTGDCIPAAVINAIENFLGTGSGNVQNLFLKKTSNLSDVNSSSSALTNLGGLNSSNNLSELTNTSTARLNLGEGSISTHPTTDFLSSSTSYVSTFNGSTGTITGLSSLNGGTGTYNMYGTSGQINIATGTASTTFSLATTSVTTGTYVNPTLTVDSFGRITSVSNGTGGSGNVVTTTTIPLLSYAIGANTPVSLLSSNDINNDGSFGSCTGGLHQNIGRATTSSVDNMKAVQLLLTATTTVTSTVIRADKTGSPVGSLEISIQTDSNGQPSGTILSSSTLSAGSVSSTAATTTFIYNTSSTLSAYTSYWLVAQQTGSQDDNNHYGVCNTVNWDGIRNGYAATNPTSTPFWQGSNNMWFNSIPNPTGTIFVAINPINDNVIGYPPNATVVTSTMIINFMGIAQSNFLNLVPLTYYLTATSTITGSSSFATSVTTTTTSHRLGIGISSTTMLMLNHY